MKFSITIFSLLLAPRVLAQEIAPTPQVLPRYSEAGAVKKEKWFAVPDTLSARVIWNRSNDRIREKRRFFWADLSLGKRRATAEFAPGDWFGNWQFSPDSARVLGDFQSGFSANQHDARVFDFARRRFLAVANTIFGFSERWSPDGARIAFFRGTTDYAAGDQRPVTLRVWEFSTQKETFLRRDDTMRNLRWTPTGDLKVDSYARRPTDAQDDKVTEIEFKNARGPRQIVAFSPAFSASPDGKWRAFWTFSKGDEKSHLEIARADGSQRKSVAVPAKSGELKWSRDSQNLWIIEQSSPDGPLIGADGWPVRLARTLKLRFWKVNALAGKSELKADLAIAQNETEAGLMGGGENVPFLTAFQTLGFSRDERYFFLRRAEWKTNPAQIILLLQANALFAVRLSDGKPFPVGVFSGEATLAPR